MTLFNKIKQDILRAYKEKDLYKANLLKTLISDIQRDPNKDYSDGKVIKVIQQTIKKLDEMIGKGIVLPNADQDIEILKTYLPQEASEKDILGFLKTIDFSKLKSPKAAIGLTKKHFQAQGKLIDAKLVSQLIEQMSEKDNAGH